MDIVEWLRGHSPTLRIAMRLDEAADEIERLRKRVNLLEGYLSGALDVVEGFVLCNTKEARKALEGGE